MTADTADFAIRTLTTSHGSSRIAIGGTGPAILYLHGVGDTGTINPLLRHLAKSRTVLRPDHAGFLGTDPLGCATVSDIAVRHLALLDTLERTGELRVPVVVIGSSFGGWVAAELALLAPERVTSLILIDPAGLRGPEPAADLYALEPAAMVALSFHHSTLKATADALDDATLEGLRGNLTAARRVAPTMSDPDLAARLAKLASPTTVVWGAEDEIFPASYAEEWRRALPEARFDVIEAAGHLPHIEQLEEFMARTGLGLPR